jgi:hypothetical protein
MENVEVKVEGNVMVVRVDLSKRLGPSASGKTIMVATTSGNIRVPGFESVKLGLNVYETRSKV